MHVAQISFFTDPQGRQPEELLLAWPSLGDVAEAAASAGMRVTVLQASLRRQSVERDGVAYHFLPVRQFERQIHADRPDVLHVHGLGFPSDVLALVARAPGIPIVLQDHASAPPRLWRRGLWRRSFAAAAGIAFCSYEQAYPFEAARLIGPATRVYEVPESTSRFTPGDRETARRVTRTTGEPLVLFVGHLDQNKDPLTVLEGVSRAARELPGLRFWCCFASGPLLGEVERRIANDPVLRNRAVLLGRVSHEKVEQLMRAADLFVLGSHHEGSGYSLIEAMACGVSPVVTDIPSFRALTADGAVGRLWPCDDASALGAAILEVAARPREETRLVVRAHFERELSSRAVGRKLREMYEDLMARNERRDAS